MRAFSLHLIFVAVSLMSVGVAWPNGGAPMSQPQMMPGRELTAEEKARMAYNAGVRGVKKAQKLEAKNTEKSLRQAHELHERARLSFEEAVLENPELYEAWNYLGYAHRKLGDFEGALVAYDRALELKPEYVEALEYRGVAYLGLNRIADAQQAYVELSQRNAGLADQLLAEMRNWIAAQRTAGSNAAAADELDRWVQQRSPPSAT